MAALVNSNMAGRVIPRNIDITPILSSPYTKNKIKDENEAENDSGKDKNSKIIHDIENNKTTLPNLKLLERILRAILVAAIFRIHEIIKSG